MKRAGLAVLGVLVAAAVVAALYIPLPFLVLAPGPALSVPSRVQFGGAPDDVSGDLLLTTVAIDQPTALEALAAWVDDDEDVIEKGEVIPPGVDEDRYFESQQELFRESTQAAAAVGLRAAGIEVPVSGAGARVTGVISDSPADGALEVEDVITAVEGRPVQLASDLVAALSQRSEGERVTITLRRGARERTEAVTLARLEDLGRPGLGVGITTVDLDIGLPFEVEVEQGDIGGPSAGLLTALAVYDLADPGDLTRGRTIAGTGTIDLDGTVGPVGGVRQKVEGAREAGATVFLVPADEADEARDAAGGDLEVLTAAALDEAIEVLGGTPAS